MMPARSDLIDVILNSFMCGVYVIAAIVVSFYGGTLFQMLKKFPIESLGRQNKLREVFLFPYSDC
jgi:hypothetical protein